MHAKLLPYYERELAYVRELGREFASDFPAVAAELGIQSGDPHVERLLEGFAFLAARVQLQIDAQYPRFTEQLLNLLYPQYLAPTPALAVVQLVPDARQTLPPSGITLPGGTLISALPPESRRSACRFRMTHPLELWPLEIVRIEHRPFRASPGKSGLGRDQLVRAELCIRIKTLTGIPLSTIEAERLRLFVGHPDAVGRRVYDLCATATRGVLFRTMAGEPLDCAGPESLTPASFADAEALLPCDQRSFHGHRVLTEYFSLPNRFMFFELSGVRRALGRCHAEEAEICVLLDRYDPALEGTLDTRHVRLFCAPVVNLFQQRADRIALSNREHEYRVVPDRTREDDLEVHGIVEVIGRGKRPEEDRGFLPFYTCTESSREQQPAFYTVHRRPRRRAHPAHARHAAYTGSDTFISLVDGPAGPYASKLQQLSVTTWCTNHDLPLALLAGSRTPFVLESAAPIRDVDLVAGPSPPLQARAWGDTAWQLIGQLMGDLQLLHDPGEPAGARLRRLLELHSDAASAAQRRQIRGICEVTSSPVVRRLPLPGPACFARGLALAVTCDEEAFEGVSLPLFGRVLASFYSRLRSINSFNEVTLLGLSGEEIQHYAALVDDRRS